MKPSHDKHPAPHPSTDRPTSGPAPATHEPAAANRSEVQGEGDYEAARVFNEAERKFVASGKVEAAAGSAAPKSVAEQQAMLAAEQEGKRRAKDRIPPPPAADRTAAEPAIDAPGRKRI